MMIMAKRGRISFEISVQLSSSDRLNGKLGSTARFEVLELGSEPSLCE